MNIVLSLISFADNLDFQRYINPEKYSGIGYQTGDKTPACIPKL
jgi:hypothetical protein